MQMQSLINPFLLYLPQVRKVLSAIITTLSNCSSTPHPSLPPPPPLSLLKIQSMGYALLHSRRRNLVIFWLLLVISSWTCAKGRPIPKLIEVEDDIFEPSTQTTKTDVENAVTVRRRILIGSRPPRCEKRCSSCGGPCQAVQVPIVPSKLRGHHRFHATPTTIIPYSRGDDISNYKPMCWKCKCGNFMFNP